MGDLVGFLLSDGGFGIGDLGLLEVSGVDGSFFCCCCCCCLGMAWNGNSIWGSYLGDLVGFFLPDGGIEIEVLGVMEVSGVDGSDDFLEEEKEKNLPLKTIASEALDIAHGEEDKWMKIQEEEEEENGRKF